MLIARFFSIEAIVRAAIRHRRTGAAAAGSAGTGIRRRCCATRVGGSWKSPTIVSNPQQRIEFLKLMDELHHVRGRAGAVFWQVYEDVAHPEGWVEVWSMESWTDHLREAIRLSDDDKRLLAAVAVFQQEAHRPSRYLAVDPHEYLHAHSRRPAGTRTILVPGASPTWGQLRISERRLVSPLSLVAQYSKIYGFARRKVRLSSANRTIMPKMSHQNHSKFEENPIGCPSLGPHGCNPVVLKQRRLKTMAEGRRPNPGNFAEDREKAARAGHVGGQHSSGNFANDRERAAEAGRKGGQASHGGSSEQGSGSGRSRGPQSNSWQLF